MKLACCKPRWRVSPSGGGWFHELNCTERPGARIWDEEKITPKPDAPKVDQQAAPLHPHPHCAAAYWDGHEDLVCPRCQWLFLHHPDCACQACGYTDAHIDDEDDIRTPEIQEQEVS